MLEDTLMTEDSTQEHGKDAGNELLDDTASSEQSVSILPNEGNQLRISRPLNLEFDQTADSNISLSDSNFTEKENSIMDDGVNDRFNSIFYNVHHSENRVTILFSTRDLFCNFVTSLKKEFTGHKSSYTTHAQGLKCVIYIHGSENGIAVSGPGCRVWRETTFLRLATNLYKQYESETNQHIDEAKRQSTAATLSQSSTPTTSRKLPDEDAPWSPVPSNNNLFHKIETLVNTQTDVKSQVSTLMEMVIAMQGQLNQLSSRLTDSENVRTEENIGIQAAPNAEMDRDSSSQTNIAATTESRPTITPGVSSYSRVVSESQTRPNTPNNIDEQLRESQTASTQQARNSGQAQTTTVNSNTSNEHSNRTLLIGDSLLSGVNKKGLKDDVHCQPLPGATIEIIKDKISMFDISKFKNVVIYVGGNDAANSDNTETFIKRYKDVITSIKKKNKDCRIYLCSSCPRGDAEVHKFNGEIEKLATENSVRFIDIYPAFYDKNEDLRTKFYGLKDWIHLSNSGTKRLLGTIDRVIPIVSSFDACVYISRVHRSTGTRKPGSNTNGRQQRNEQPVSHHSSGRNFGSGHLENRDYNTNYHQGSNYSYSNQVNRNSHYNQEEDLIYENWNYNHSSPVQRCCKCGLTNHKTVDCRHGRQLLCFECKLYGHKDSVCWNI